MAKSEILKEVANNEISVEIALRRLYIIASDLEDNALITWIDKELNGYSEEDIVPEYRNIGAGSICYSGIKGSMMSHIKISNSPLPFQCIPKEFQEMTQNHYRRDTIASIEQESKQKEAFINDFSAMIPYMNIGVAITTLYRQYDPSVFREIVNKMSAMLLKIYTKLDKTIGNLDDLDIGNITHQKREDVTTYIEKIVFTDNSIRVGDGNKIEKSELMTKGE